MNDYLQQFRKLPKEIKDAVSSDEKVKLLEEIEKKYNLKLTKLVVRIMIKDILWQDLEKFCQDNFKLSPEKASELKKDLAEKIFNEVIDYLTEEKKEEISKTEPIPLEEIVKNIKEKLGLIFEDEILEKRFENIISSYFKEVRNEVQLEEILSRSKKIGGMELPPEKVSLIVDAVKKEKEKINSESKIKDYSPKEKLEEIFTPQPVFLEEKEEKEGTGLPSFQFNEEKKKKFEGGTITPLLKEISFPPLYQVKETKEKEEKETIEIPVQIQEPISDEKKIEDISFKPPAIGPIEELSEINLIDFQRWGAEKTSQIILDKINLLAEESLFKKAEGIRAWQDSPLFKLYLEIGQEAMEKKKSLSEIIEERKLQNKPTLEFEDFLIISELNKKLRF